MDRPHVEHETTGHQATDHEATDDHLGAVEGDRPGDTPQQGNPHADALDDQGLPSDEIAICEDVLGANADGTEG